VSEERHGFEVWGQRPEVGEDSRVALWPEMNLVVPVHSEASKDADADAVKLIALPRVPVAGEQVEIIGRWAIVEQVQWGRKQPPAVQLHPLVAVLGLTESLTADGFTLITREER
jgi:hypothetical protein